MDADTRVCPHCGEPPGNGVFCAACGRNLATVEQLPTRAAWEGTPAEDAAAPGDLAARCADATAAFVRAMHAAGDPGTVKFAIAGRTGLLRTPSLEGWVVRPVDREDFEEPHRYAPGLFLTTDGRFHRLDSQLRGHGQRNFPVYHHTVQAEPLDPPAEERLIGELDALARDARR